MKSKETNNYVFKSISNCRLIFGGSTKIAQQDNGKFVFRGVEDN